MTDRSFSPEEERLDTSEIEETQESPESRQLEQATHEPEALVEATRGYEEAEQIESSVAELVQEADVSHRDDIAWDDEPQPPPDRQAEISVLPVPVPSPEDEIANDLVPLPSPADEISTIPIPLPEPTSAEYRSDDLIDEPIRELDVQKPGFGLKEPDAGMTGSSELEDLIPGRGSLIGPDGNPMEDGNLGLDGIIGADVGFGPGGPGDLSHESASDHPDVIPGTDSPFIPGKGPGSGVMAEGGMRDDKLDKFLEDEAAGKADRENREDNYAVVSPIRNSGAGKDGFPHTIPPAQVPDDEQPPPPKRAGTKSDFEEEGSGKAEISVQGEMNPRYDSGQISLTTPDDPEGGGTDGTLKPEYAEKIEEALKLKNRMVHEDKPIGSEVITDPPEHDPKSSRGASATEQSAAPVEIPLQDAGGAQVLGVKSDDRELDSAAGEVNLGRGAQPNLEESDNVENDDDEISATPITLP